MSTTTMTPTDESETITLTSADRPGRHRAGRKAMVLGIVAAVGGLVTTGYVGATIVPMQLEAGRFLTDTPVAYQGTVYGALFLVLGWAAVALAAVVTSIVALVRRDGTAAALVGLLAGLGSPVGWFLAFLVPALVMNAILA